VTDDRLDLWQQVGGAYNIGIFHWRPTESAKKLAREWKDMLVADDKIWDQNGFNDLVHRQLGPTVDDESGLVYAYLLCSGDVSATQIRGLCCTHHIPICRNGRKAAQIT
nr:arabinosyltransferase XEG113 [Tanacetum cinerariifolium]